MNITWKIDSLETKPTVGDFQDVVYTAHWRVYGTEDVHTASVYGSMTLTFDPNTSNFVPYEQLTEEVIVGWVKDAMGSSQVQSIEDNLQSQIDNLKHPPVVTKSLPWVSVVQ